MHDLASRPGAPPDAGSLRASYVLAALAVATLLTDIVPGVDATWIVALAAYIAVATGVFVAIRIRPTPTWPVVVIVAAQLLTGAHATADWLAPGSVSQSIDTVTTIATLLLAVAWGRLALGRRIGWDSAAALDTGVILLGLLGTSAILGAPAYQPGADGMTVGAVVAAAAGSAYIATIAYGTYARRPAPLAYQFVLVAAAVTIILRIVQVISDSQGVDITTRTVLSSTMITSLAMAAAMLHPSFRSIGQARHTRPDLWSIPRASGILAVSLMPVWAAYVADEDSVVSAAILAGIVLLLLLRVLLASRFLRTAQQAELRALTRDPVTGAPLVSGLKAADHGRTDGYLGPRSLVRIWLVDSAALFETAGRSVCEAAEHAWAQAVDAALPEPAVLCCLSRGEYAVAITSLPDAALMQVSAIVDSRASSVRVNGETLPMRADCTVAPLSTLEESDVFDALALAGAARRFRPPGAGIGTPQLREEWAQRNRLARQVLADEDWTGLKLTASPLVDLASASVAGYVIGCLWQGPDGGAVGADLLRDITTDLSMVAGLDMAVLERALSWTGPEGGAAGVLSVSIDPAVLLQPGGVARIAELHRARAWAESTVWLAVTETGRHDSPRDVNAALQVLDRAGLVIAMDGFGAAASALPRLADHHVSAMVLDAELTRAIDGDAVRRTLLRHMLELAADIPMTVVADGVATERERSTLTYLGCPYATGPLYGPPAPLDDQPALGSPVTAG